MYSSSASHLSNGAMVGIFVAIAIGIVIGLVAFAIIFIRRRRGKSKLNGHWQENLQSFENPIYQSGAGGGTMAFSESMCNPVYDGRPDDFDGNYQELHPPSLSSGLPGHGQGYWNYSNVGAEDESFYQEAEVGAFYSFMDLNSSADSSLAGAGLCAVNQGGKEGESESPYGYVDSNYPLVTKRGYSVEKRNSVVESEYHQISSPDDYSLRDLSLVRIDQQTFQRDGRHSVSSAQTPREMDDDTVLTHSSDNHGMDDKSNAVELYATVKKFRKAESVSES